MGFERLNTHLKVSEGEREWHLVERPMKRAMSIENWVQSKNLTKRNHISMCTKKRDVYYITPWCLMRTRHKIKVTCRQKRSLKVFCDHRQISALSLRQMLLMCKQRKILRKFIAQDNNRQEGEDKLDTEWDFVHRN